MASQPSYLLTTTYGDFWIEWDGRRRHWYIRFGEHRLHGEYETPELTAKTKPKPD